MRSAIAFGMLIVIFGVLMLEVSHALSAFLLAFMGKATAMINSLPTHPALMSQ